jgi:hypothetical protein
MRSFLINKNLCLYYWLKKTIGKKAAFEIANLIQRILLIFGRELVPCDESGQVIKKDQQ